MATNDSNTPHPNGLKDWGFNHLINTVNEIEQQGAERTYPDFTVYFPDHSKHLPDDLYELALGYIDAILATDINGGPINYPTTIEHHQFEIGNIVDPVELISSERVFNTEYFNSCNKSSRLLFLAVASYLDYKSVLGIPKESELMPLLNRYAFWIMFWSCVQ